MRHAAPPPPAWTDWTQRVKAGVWAADRKIPWTLGERQGMAPLVYVALGAPDSALLRACLAAGARLSARFDLEGAPPPTCPTVLDAVKHDAHLLLLLQHGLLWHVPTVDAHRDFPLHRAVAQGWPLSVRWMLARGAVVQVRNGQRALPLHAATRHAIQPGHWPHRQAIVKALVTAGADLTQTDEAGETALVGAARRCPALAPLLLSLSKPHQVLQIQTAETLLAQARTRLPEAAWAWDQMQRIQLAWRTPGVVTP